MADELRKKDAHLELRRRHATTMKTNDDNILKESQRVPLASDLKHAAQRELAADVLKQAEHDLRRFYGATSNFERELCFDTYRWLTVDEWSSPFSFLNVCQSLNLAPENVRQELIGDSVLGALNYWTQRCTRAARGVRASVTQLFLGGRNASAGMPICHAEAQT
jgi:hypothetical protein